MDTNQTAQTNPEPATAPSNTEVAASEDAGSLLTGQGQTESAESATESKDSTEAKAEAVPEKYEFTMPEGVEADSEMLAEFEPIAKELGLSQEKAQKLVDIQIKSLQKSIQRMQADHEIQQEEAFKEMTTQWATAAKADSEYGGAKFNENLSVAQKALKQFASEGLIEYLNSSGLGNHPEVIRTFVKVGKAISEDSFVVGGQGGARATDPAKVIYPNLA